MAPWNPAFVSAIDGELAARNNKPPFILFQLATVSPDGYPRNRTLVHRGFLFDNKSNNVLVFCTDRRMGKFLELQENDHFEAVYYFEKVRKQFRIRGHARLLDHEHTPQLDLLAIQPRRIIEMHSRRNSGDFSDSDTDDDDFQRLNISVTSSRTSAGNNCTKSVLETPLAYPLILPNLLGSLAADSDSCHQSYPNLHELGHLEFVPPSQTEWENERRRLWDLLSPSLKLTFRKPAPNTPMTDEHHKLMDKISRGVDGKKEDSGLLNFVVVVMFVERVDYYEMEKDRRYIYEMDAGHLWTEQEVCP